MSTIVATKERPILLCGEMVRAILDGRKTMTRRLVKPQPAEGQRMTWFAKNGDGVYTHWKTVDDNDYTKASHQCPQGMSGDRLWVRETFAARNDVSHQFEPEKARHYARYRATHKGNLIDEWHRYDGWKPSIHMPRALARIELEITAIRVERVQDITEADVDAEGFESREGDGGGPGPGFKWRGRGYWDGISYHSDGVSGKTYHAARMLGGSCECNLGREARHSPAICAYRHSWDALYAKSGSGWDANPFVWVIEFKRIGATS